MFGDESAGGSFRAASGPMGRQHGSAEGLLKRPSANSSRRDDAAAAQHGTGLQGGLYPSSSNGRPLKQIRESTGGQLDGHEASYPANTTTTVAATYVAAGHDDGSTDEEEQEQRAEQGAVHAEYEAAEGQAPEQGQQAPGVELTDIVAAGIVAMASRRAVLLDKIDALTDCKCVWSALTMTHTLLQDANFWVVSDSGVQGIEQLKADFKAEMARLRAQVVEGTDTQEHEWRHLSNETRAAEERLRCARGLVETLNAQGLGSIAM